MVRERVALCVRICMPRELTSTPLCSPPTQYTYSLSQGENPTHQICLPPDSLRFPLINTRWCEIMTSLHFQWLTSTVAHRCTPHANSCPMIPILYSFVKFPFLATVRLQSRQDGFRRPNGPHFLNLIWEGAGRSPTVATDATKQTVLLATVATKQTVLLATVVQTVGVSLRALSVATDATKQTVLLATVATKQTVLLATVVQTVVKRGLTLRGPICGRRKGFRPAPRCVTRIAGVALRVVAKPVSSISTLIWCCERYVHS